MEKKSSLTKIRLSYNRKWKYVLCMLPVIILYLIFSYYPKIMTIPLSFYKWGPYNDAREFVGWWNFEVLFQLRGEQTMLCVKNTLIYVGGLFAVQTALALTLAVALQKNTRVNKAIRTYIFFPLLLSSTVITLTWSYMYDPNLGVINNILGTLGVEGYPGVNFMAENWRAVLMIVVVHIWAGIGYPMMIIHAGLASVSEELGEAAKIDGASSWQTFWKITFPLMLPTLMRMTLMTLSAGVMTSEYIVMMGDMSSIVSYDTLASYIYKRTRMSSNYGEISAMCTMLMLIMGVISLIQFFTMKKVEKSILGE